MKVKLSFGHTAVITSLSKLNIKSDLYILGHCFRMRHKSESLAVNWSHISHFVTFWTKHQIKIILFQKLFSLICYLDNVTKNLKVKLSFGHKAVILSLSKLNIESKNFFYKSCSVWNVIWECDKKIDKLGLSWAKLSSSWDLTLL